MRGERAFRATSGVEEHISAGSERVEVSSDGVILCELPVNMWAAALRRSCAAGAGPGR